MEDTSIYISLASLLKYLIPPLIAWNVWLHNKVSGLVTAMAVNEAKDDEVIKSLDKWDLRWIELEKQLKEIYDRLPLKK